MSRAFFVRELDRTRAVCGSSSPFARSRTRALLLGILSPAVVPTVILGLGVLVSVIQAYVFVLLTALYLAGAVEEAH